MLTSFQVQPVALPDFDYLAETGAAGALVAPDGVFVEWDNLFKKGFEQYVEKLQEERWYGLLNWGDWFGERVYNWGNLEYDDAAGFFWQALRFQDPEYFRQAVRGARHYIDVDTVSQHGYEDWEGRVWGHALGHTGGYYKAGTFHLNNYDMSDSIFHTGSGSPGHTRCEGVSLLYLLTGDIRAIEYARKIANHLSKGPMVSLGTP